MANKLTRALKIIGDIDMGMQEISLSNMYDHYYYYYYESGEC